MPAATSASNLRLSAPWLAARRKSYRMIGTELSIEYAALESGLDRFVRLDKDDFTGRAGLLEWHQRGFANRFVTLSVNGPEDADPIGNNPPVSPAGEMVGRATSRNYGFRLEQSPAAWRWCARRSLPLARRWRSRSWAGSTRPGWCRKVPGIRKMHGCGRERSLSDWRASAPTTGHRTPRGVQP